MRRLRRDFVGLAVASLCATSSGADLGECRSVEDGRATLVAFDAHRSAGSEAKLAGLLVRPHGSGRQPAVILLHRVFGVESPDCFTSEQERYGSWGYVSLLVDSDSLPPSSRSGAPDTSTGYDFVDQAGDAVAAATFLDTLPFVDAHRIVLVGHAFGGSAALRTVMTESFAWTSPMHASFAGVIAWHPFCPDARRGFSAPALILVGARDSHQPVGACEALANLSDPDFPVHVRTFDESGHNFDVEWMPEFDPVATERAYDFIRAFLREYAPAIERSGQRSVGVR